MPGSERLRDSADLDKLLKRHLARGDLTAAICAAPVVVLGEKGYLEVKLRLKLKKKMIPLLPILTIFKIIFFRD